MKQDLIFAATFVMTPKNNQRGTKNNEKATHATVSGEQPVQQATATAERKREQSRFLETDRARGRCQPLRDS